MYPSKSIVTILMYFFVILSFSCLTAQGPTLSIVSNQNGVVTYASTGTNLTTGVFTLYGDGHYGRALNPWHKFESSTIGYNSTAFYLTPYDDNPPFAQAISTNSIGTGNTKNEPYFMSSDTKIETSWNPTQENDAYYVLLFTNTTLNSIDGCVNFYYKNSEIDINTSGILQKSDWVSNRETIAGSYGIYDRRMKWNFYNLAPGEQRVVYIPFKSLLPAGSYINASSSLSTNCNHIPSSLPNQSLKVSNYPHDPNRKTVFGCIDRTDNNAQNLRFTIDFQNIGTGPAQNIVIGDQLSPELDPSTITMLPAQYPFTYNVSSSRLTITFSGINLPGTQQESVNIDDTKSSVSFSICTFPDPDCVSNTATIIFDNQLPITTNTVEACDIKASCAAEICTHPAKTTQRSDINGNGAALGHIDVYPNPVDDVLYLRFTDAVSKIELINISGQILQTYNIESQIHEKTIDFSNWNSGLYFIRLTGENQNNTMKVIKN